MGSMATFITFSSIDGMTLARMLPSTVIEGLELASMRRGVRLESSMKSSPNISKQYCLRWGLS